MNEAIQGLVAGEALYTLFQPIIDGATREPIGHEALTRGPPGPFELPTALIAGAAAAGLSIPLERRCLESALRSFRALRLEGRLFLNLVLPIPGVGANTQVGEVLELFRANAEWTALAVLESERPVGLVYRDELLIFLSRPLHPEIYGRKPISSLMTRDTVQVEARARLDQVSRVVTARSARPQRDDFIITRNGLYLGLGRTFDLLRQITAQQIQAARHSNPLTGLPGNREIQRHLSQWLARRRHFVACHLDLDHFKAFNDAYGYARGDQVLLHVSQVISQVVRPRVDFVGHVGGDDFVFLMRSQDWTLRLIALIEELAASLVNFHSSEHREAGGLVGVDRDGATRRFPLLSASIAAFEVDSSDLVSPDIIAESLLQTKALAKAKAGCSCLLAVGDRVIDLVSRVETIKRLPTEQALRAAAHA